MSKHDEIESAEFILTKERYLQPVGESAPRFIAASPGSPVKVTLPAKLWRKVKNKETGETKEVLQDQPIGNGLNLASAPPPKPKPVLPDLKKDPIRKSHEAKPSEAKHAAEGRAADK